MDVHINVYMMSHRSPLSILQYSHLQVFPSLTQFQTIRQTLIAAPWGLHVEEVGTYSSENKKRKRAKTRDDY